MNSVAEKVGGFVFTGIAWLGVTYLIVRFIWIPITDYLLFLAVTS